MSTVMPQNELHRRAIQWINDEKREHPQKSLSSLIDDTGMRFNLSPQDAEFLENFFKNGATTEVAPPPRTPPAGE